MFGDGQSRRRRVSGVLDHGVRGLNIQTEAGDLWVLDRDGIDADLLGRRVTAEGTLIGFDRIQVDWIGAAQKALPSARRAASKAADELFHFPLAGTFKPNRPPISSRRPGATGGMGRDRCRAHR